MTAEEDKQLLLRVALRFAGAQLERGACLPLALSWALILTFNC